ncbi:thiol reductant ABC exporter subunit CydC [Marinobacter sp. F4206]|uniref:thiol reductant ABC exporter subunit CydC n=1 Tax=Marinobacter sp. F4206 TaxID=2861777 RepID=UPI001C6037E1|nr:thiol reductant ABC exporter subunit CydC [Marinobacter sp. F4206]MBW4933237.1 thiol reductant ABC exporter subunit CydC [Marinobacter sp. F4206]
MRELAPWLRLIFQRPVRLTVGGGLILITLLSGIGLLALSGWFITETALVGLALAAGTQATINLYTPGGGIRFFALSRTVGRYVERVYNHDTVLRLLTDIRVHFFRRLAATPPLHRSGLSGAQWLSRLTRDVDALDTLYLRLIAPTALAALVVLLVVVLAGLWFSTMIAFWLAVILLAALLLSTLGIYLRTRRIASQQSEREERLRAAVIEHLEGFAELAAAGRTGKHAAWLMRQAQQFSSEQTKADRRVGWHLAGSHLLINLAATFALWAGLSLFQFEIISGPVLVLLPIALLGLSEVYAALPDAFGKLGATETSAERLNRQSEQPAWTPTAGADDLPAGKALLARDLGVRHTDSAPIFNHFDLSVDEGEHLGVVGHSGSGKSSLADALSGLIPAYQGSISHVPLCYLTQTTILFEDTLRANLLLAHPQASEDELWQVLDLVEMADRFASEEDRLDTWLGSAGSRLSGGEARRVALARVLLSPAPLIILDEPFTGVDSETRERICRRLDQWLAGKAVIALAHDADALPGTDHVIHLTY